MTAPWAAPARSRWFGGPPLADETPREAALRRDLLAAVEWAERGGVVYMQERRHILRGDLDALEYAVADYIAKWGEHFTGRPYMGEFGTNIAGMPTGAANMAMTVIRKNLVASWTEDVALDSDQVREAR